MKPKPLPIMLYAAFDPHCPFGVRLMTSSDLGLAADELSPSSTTSPTLLERIKAGDAAAWDRLVRLYAPLVYRWCHHWDLPDQEIADVFQDVFQAVSLHVAGFRKDRPGDTFRGWLRTIAHNKVRDHFRKLGREPGGAGGTDAQIRLTMLPAVESPDREDADGEQADRELFRRALELIRTEFEERTWRAFWQTAVEDRAPKDVAAELSMSPGAVRVAKSRVLRRLRQELGEL
jgi:RNA polymerase sigma-70 factor (ECF subfamily)